MMANAYTMAGDIASMTSAENAAAVTPDNDNDLATAALALYIGTGGNVALITTGGDTVTFSNLPDAALLPVQTARVLATNTTATDIVALW